MKIYAHYDSEGNIHSLITGSASERVEAMLLPQPGLYVGEVEGLKIKDARDADAIRKIAESHRVGTPGSQIKLIKK